MPFVEVEVSFGEFDENELISYIKDCGYEVLPNDEVMELHDLAREAERARETGCRPNDELSKEEIQAIIQLLGVIQPAIASPLYNVREKLVRL